MPTLKNIVPKSYSPLPVQYYSVPNHTGAATLVLKPRITEGNRPHGVLIIQGARPCPRHLLSEPTSRAAHLPQGAGAARRGHSAEPARGSSSIPESAHITLNKMGPHNKPEAFLALFKHAAEVWRWPAYCRS